MTPQYVVSAPDASRLTPPSDLPRLFSGPVPGTPLFAPGSPKRPCPCRWHSRWSCLRLASARRRRHACLSRRSGRAERRARSDAGSTSTRGFARRTTPRCRPTSRPRTPTPKRSSPRRAPSSRRSTRRCSAASSETDQSVPSREGGFALLLAHRGGAAVPDPLPARDGAGKGPRAGRPRPQRARRGTELPLARRLPGERRRAAAGLRGRRHGLARPRAVREEPRDREGARARGRPRRVGGVGRRRPDALLHRRGRAHAGGSTASSATRSEARPTRSSTKSRTRRSTSASIGPAAGHSWSSPRRA